MTDLAANYLDLRATDPEDAEIELQMAAARDADQQKSFLSKAAGFGGDLVSALGDAKQLGPNLAIAAYDAIRNVGETALDAGTAAVNLGGQQSAARTVQTLANPLGDAKDVPELDLVDLFPSFIGEADKLREQLGKGSTTADVVVQKTFQFLAPFTAALRATRFAQAQGAVGKGVSLLGADVATNVSVWDPQEARFGELLQSLAPDNSLVARFTDYAIARPDDTEMEGRWRNAIDSIAAMGIITPVLAAAGVALKLGKHGLTELAKGPAAVPGGPVAQRGGKPRKPKE